MSAPTTGDYIIRAIFAAAVIVTAWQHNDKALLLFGGLSFGVNVGAVK